MQYIQPIGAPTNDPYVDANPSLGIDGSPVPAAAIEHPMREIEAVISGAGMTPSSGDLTQLRQAIGKMVQAGQRAVVIDTVTFAGGVVNGNAVYWDSANTRFDKALSDGTAKQNCVGFADVTNAKVYAFGDTVLFTGLTPGARYYLDATTAGTITATAPANGVYLGIARTATEIFVDIDGLGVQANQANHFTKGQSSADVALPATTGTLNIDFTLSNNFSGQVTGPCTFSNGYTGPGAGKKLWFSIDVKQGAASLYNWAFGTNWKYVGGSAAIPSQTQVLGALDQIHGEILADGTISFDVRSDIK